MVQVLTCLLRMKDVIFTSQLIALSIQPECENLKKIIIKMSLTLWEKALIIELFGHNPILSSLFQFVRYTGTTGCYLRYLIKSTW